MNSRSCFHEASHGLTGKLRAAIEEATSKLPSDKQPAISSSLWHAVLFYSAGELTVRENPGYEPYALHAGLWARVWHEPVHALLIKDWKPHMDGELTLGAAVSQLISDLASTP